MKLYNKIAFKFLFSDKSFSNLNSKISTLSIASGTFSLMISLSVLNGFESQVINKIKDFDGHIRITGKNIILSYKKINKLFPNYELSLFKKRQILINHGDKNTLVIAKAINSDKMESFYDFRVEGRFPDQNSILIGSDIANRLMISIGDSVIIHSPLDMTAFIGLPPMKKLRVSGIFESRILDYDDRFVFIDYNTGTSLFNKYKNNSGIDLKIPKSLEVDEVYKKLKLFIPSGLNIQTYIELHHSLIQAMRLERVGAIFILSLIIIVASFNLLSSISLLSIQKLSQIGILKSMGMQPKEIKKILLTQSFYRGGLGSFGGILIGFILITLQHKTGFIKLQTEIYFLDTLPMEITLLNIITIISLSFIFIFIFSYIAVHKISNVKTKEAINWMK